jgi:hypothetical protein
MRDVAVQDSPPFTFTVLRATSAPWRRSLIGSVCARVKMARLGDVRPPPAEQGAAVPDHPKWRESAMFVRKAMTLAGLALAVAALGPASAPAAVEGTDRPVQGSASGMDSVNVQTLAMEADINVLMSHLGESTAHFQGQGALTPEGTVAATGTFTIVAANGDELTGTFTLAGPAPSFGVHTIDVVMAITGGSGRFAGATGTLSTTQLVTPLSLEGTTLRQAMEGAVSGQISY